MTITPNELRLGNWVKWPDEKEPNEVQWSHGHWLGVFEKNYGYPEGIELTPEWLERFGYEKLSNYEEGYMDEDYIWYFMMTITDQKYSLCIRSKIGFTVPPVANLN